MAEILRFFHDTLGASWGWSIIILTVLVKIVLFPTSLSQLRSMEAMKKIQPLLTEIQEKYKKNPEEQQRRIMEVYKTHNVNPLGGCLPLLIQLPFLWALFGLLRSPERYQIDMVGATFMGMVLTQDKYIVLSLISGLSTFWQQKLSSPAGQEQSQKTFLYIMPVFLGYITYTLKAGLGLYWVASNLLGIVQQWVVTRFFIPRAEGGEDGQTISVKAKKVKAEGNQSPQKD